MTEEKKYNDPIVLGSGRIYVDVYDGITVPNVADIEKDEKELGNISGGATLEAAETFYTAKDDLDKIRRKKMTGDEYTLSTGIMTINAGVLEKTLSTVNVSENTERGTKELKLGGVSHYKEQRYIFLFVNEDKDVRIMLLGSNEAGLTLQFMKDKETVINQKIVGEPFPDGHKVIIELVFRKWRHNEKQCRFYPSQQANV